MYTCFPCSAPLTRPVREGTGCLFFTAAQNKTQSTPSFLFWSITAHMLGENVNTLFLWKCLIKGCDVDTVKWACVLLTAWTEEGRQVLWQNGLEVRTSVRRLSQRSMWYFILWSQTFPCLLTSAFGSWHVACTTLGWMSSGNVWKKPSYCSIPHHCGQRDRQDSIHQLWLSSCFKAWTFSSHHVPARVWKLIGLEGPRVEWGHLMDGMHLGSWVSTCSSETELRTFSGSFLDL